MPMPSCRAGRGAGADHRRRPPTCNRPAARLESGPTMAKKKLPKTLALLNEDMCTGCEACMSVCPVDCISVIPGPRHELTFQVCTIDLPRCIGCTLCHQVCPWDCITMLPTDQFLQNANPSKELE